MDVNDLRVVVTVLSFVAFVGIVVWAWSSRNRERFDEASRLPFAGDEAAPPAPTAAGRGDPAKQPQPDTRR